jgi:hypothetical protein
MRDMMICSVSVKSYEFLYWITVVELWWDAHIIIGTLKSKKRYKIINKSKIINLCFRIDD